MTGYNGLTTFLAWVTEDLAFDGDMRRRFLAWVQENAPEEWATFALQRGKHPTDGELVLDAAILLQRAVRSWITVELDRLSAIVEARAVLEGDSPP